MRTGGLRPVIGYGAKRRHSSPGEVPAHLGDLDLDGLAWQCPLDQHDSSVDQSTNDIATGHDLGTGIEDHTVPDLYRLAQW
jgi:hypothetical protein